MSRREKWIWMPHAGHHAGEAYEGHIKMCRKWAAK